MKTKRISFLLLAALALAVPTGCDRGKYLVVSGYAQGGVYTVKYNAKDVKTKYSVVCDSIDAILTGIDNSVSGYNKSSILSRRNAGEDIPTDNYYDELCRLSDEFYRFSDGAFDVAAGPLFDVWGFGFTSDSLPSPEVIQAAKAQAALRKKLNFNAIAQGYTCDVVARYLYSIGVKDMLVDIGEIFCDGVNPSGEGWTIGIDNPFDGNDTPGADIRDIWQSDGGPHGIVTSGNYRKFYIHDGKKYAHTLDPRTGYPVQHSLLSATVVAPTAAAADALATICMVYGEEASRDMILSDPDLEACLILADTLWKSPGFDITSR